jgi:hypothetical protein
MMGVGLIDGQMGSIFDALAIAGTFAGDGQFGRDLDRG